MPRWKSTEQILNPYKKGEVFEENWMNYNSIYDYMPNPIKWKSPRKIKFEDVYIWEVIIETGGAFGVYAAWQPYSSYFIVTKNWSIIKEFWGITGEKKLYEYLKKINIKISLNKIWVDKDYIYE